MSADPTTPDLRAEWDEACYNARENWTVDPHQHIERLITAGDAALAALPAEGERQPAGWHDGTLYCYGGCGRRYGEMGPDVILPTPLWNHIAVGAPFHEPVPGDETEGRGGVLCCACTFARLAALPQTTVVRMTVDHEDMRRMGLSAVADTMPDTPPALVTREQMIAMLELAECWRCSGRCG